MPNCSGSSPMLAIHSRDQSGVLARRQIHARTTPAGEQESPGCFWRCSEVVVDGLPRVLGQLELDGVAGLLLAHGRAIDGVASGATSSTLTLTTSQPRSLLSMARLNSARSRLRPSTWSLVRIDQTCLGRSGGLAPIIFPLFQGLASWVGFEQISLVLHGRSPLLQRSASMIVGAPSG